ncbi:hypothetical protein CMI45_01870 [Candidatus Pacearchaeota archaeon]|nr:hypothetical protein [Candidatus Pacearchaeota archaeon]|tara:strand:+ start:2266 stop:2646 length:381 start_codon:yes stop_codon:yes gene_type:complete
MTIVIQGADIDEVFYKVARELLRAREYSPRGLKTKELVMPMLIIENPERCVITNPARRLNIDYLQAELDWYLSFDKNVEGIKDYASMWEKLADLEGCVNSNYGEIVFEQELENYSGNQYEWALESC